jgi:hypothetical protein
MSDFRSRLRSIRAEAEERANRKASPRDPLAEAEARESERYAAFVAALGTALDELTEGFAEEFDGFESIRVAMETGQCVRLSKLEEIEEQRKLSRLTFNLEDLAERRGIHLSCKSIVFNRERGHDEIELAYHAGGDPTLQAAADQANQDALGAARSFAEQALLAFAAAYEDTRMSSQESP